MKRILIVDDEPDVLSAIKSSLERQRDFKVSVAQDGEEALEILKNETPDLVVLDLVMPKVGGEQLLRLIRQNERTVAVPVIISTVRRETSSLAGLMKAGATDYLMKPYDIQELIKTVNNYI
jgi:two-component system alkaline phosphatase synthesis response regulator PhoP